ncbi:PilZ domain-containing protein [Butyricicoccus sp. 1XD8-22]|nr:PilZ domain-containing protein [Butyricicoccus sp. 1XD8-22]
MIFKRQEGFRFVFNEPIEASFVVISTGEKSDAQKIKHSCKILDLSARGLKIYTEAEIGEYKNKPFSLEIHFVLDVTQIHAVGEIIWSRPFGQGRQYGIQLPDQPDIVDLIISEMKERRGKEVLN